MTTKAPACVTCKYYKSPGIFSIQSPECLHPRCVDKAFDYYDKVTGETTHYEQKQSACFRARSYGRACGPSGDLWEQCK